MKIRAWMRSASLVILAAALSGCASLHLVKRAPHVTDTGYGFHYTPRIADVGNEWTLHAGGAFSQLWAITGSGVFNRLEGILQARRVFDARWVGVEAGYADFGAFSSEPTPGGPSLGVISGMGVGPSRYGLNLYAAVGMQHYGRFGVGARVGIELQRP